MAIEQSRSRNKAPKPRQFKGETEASFLIAALNGNTVVEAKRLLEIVGALQEIAAIKPIRGRQLLVASPDRKLQVAKVEKVNAYLRNLEAVPVIALPSTVDKRIRLEWRRTGQSVARAKQLRSSADLELSAIQHAIALTEMKRISSVRQCDRCHRWFFGKFSHSRFCPNTNCHDLFHQEDPATREKKRIKARENYHYVFRDK